MILSRLSIFNYKNIAEATLDFSPKVNCLLGNNGMGKTNVLDAIFYLSFCQSSLARTDANTVRYGEEFMLLQGTYERSGKTEQIACAIQRGKKKSVKRNGKEYRRQSEHIGLLPLVMVTPSDWNLIVGGSEERRRLIDRIISQGNHDYLDRLIGYNRALEQRNAMLKQGIADPLLLETVDSYLCNAAAAIHDARKQWIEQFTPIFMRYYNIISDSNEQVRLDYRSALNDRPMAEVLRANIERDRVLGHTSQGVHRDDIELMLGDELMRRTGSQGQCKTYTIALRLAQFDFLKSMCGQTPLLLLDDIFDKLDANRVGNIMRIVSEPAFGQIFVSDTNRQHLDETIDAVGSDYRIFSVDNGNCRQVGGEYAMKRREPVLLSEVMKQFLNPADLDDNANRQRLMSYWRTVVGDYIAKQTSRMWIKDRVLHVVVNSAPLRNELMFVRSSLVARLNAATGISVIDDISFH